MLDLKVAMGWYRDRLLLALVVVLLVLPSQPRLPRAQQVRATPTTPTIVISSPLPGEALQGQVMVQGSLQVEGVQSLEVSFGYQNDPTSTWFVIQQGSAPGETLAQWDTTTITDGIYRLRVQVFLQDGQVLERQVEGLRVRNYSLIETSTPVAVQMEVEQALPTPTATALPDFEPPARTPRVLPTNPAQLTETDLRSGVLVGVSLVAAGLALAVIYIGLKALFRR